LTRGVVLSSQKIKRLLDDVKAMTTLSLDSDHRLVLVKCSLQLKQKRERLRVKVLKDENVRQQHSTQIEEISPANNIYL